MRIYVDACALNRLTDDPGQPRIRMEAAAMERIFKLVETGRAMWIASSVLVTEIRKNPDPKRREDALAMATRATEIHFPDSQIATRAGLLHSLGYGEFDALHLAFAERFKADVLLTTDDRFLRQARRELGNPSVRVANPLEYEKEAQP